MKKMNKFYFAFAACLAANTAWAADAISGEVQQRPLNIPAVVMFLFCWRHAVYHQVGGKEKQIVQGFLHGRRRNFGVSKRFGDCG
ncbi:hypothetical protein NEIELOOT_01264 [Neisseria elongata subsp. glycolytica ATCC 29315]|uniref:Uncharacterized protein n=1 Tax=Neisseria elongata subsp. glycolytica ATCC 29315 TaxID=546263 RepID=D4DQC7_NEIEG|nr:hypothetical protein NEIELOOT_01264 [Neisseria elongata subsp. glycolytica ATCC 29315]